MAKSKSRFRKKVSRLPVKPILIAGTVISLYLFWGLPSLDDAKPLHNAPSIVIQANDGTMITRYGGVSGDVLDVKELPPHLIDALLAVEDRRFYAHFGIDPIGLTRAMARNVWARRWVQGGSTITQQLAKNMFLTPDKTLRRKFQEMIMALKIERRFTKDEILTAYLNRVYFGAGAYGVDAAAHAYFNKPATRLSLWESAVLAGLLKAPSRFSPASNPELAKRRASVVIEAMEDAGYINKKTMERELKAEHNFPPVDLGGDLSRYFTDWVLDQVDGFITDNEGDIVVRTTLDPKLQLMAEAKQKALFARIPTTDKVGQAALLTLSKDGAVRAMLGGVNYKASQFNRVTQARRQPGSAFKPFVFLAALEHGTNPDDKIDDSPIREGEYRPDNYDNKYFGETTVAFALAKSLNAATTRLLDDTGMDAFLDVVSRLGFTSPIKRELASGLGASEVTLMELTTAYAVIANGGQAVWPYAVLSIKDSAGNLLYQYTPPEHPQVFDEDKIEALDHMLEGVVTIGTGTAAQLIRGHVAGKTGTTQNYRDALFVGYTDNLITGVWMGNDDNKPMLRVTGGRYPAQLWHDYMNEAIGFSIPKFEPEDVSEDFSSLIDRWSAAPADEEEMPSFRESKKPLYNN